MPESKITFRHFCAKFVIMKKRILSLLLSTILLLTCISVPSKIQAASIDDTIFKIDGTYEFVSYTESDFYEAPMVLVRVPTNTTEIRINVDAEYGVLTDYDYSETYGGFKPSTEYHTWTFDGKQPIYDNEKSDWVDSAYVQYDLYIAAFIDNLDDANEIADIIFFKSDTPIHGSGDEASAEEKQELRDLLKTVTDEQTTWYKENDRYNGKDVIADSDSGFWKQFIAPNGPRATAKTLLDGTPTSDQIEAAKKDLNNGIRKLIPCKQINPTNLYETIDTKT